MTTGGEDIEISSTALQDPGLEKIRLHVNHVVLLSVQWHHTLRMSDTE
jgi:hypothetical protein